MTKKTAVWLPFFKSFNLLRGVSCASGADVSASAAVFAFGGIDHVFVSAGGNGTFGAFGLASAAADAIITNDMGHIFGFLS
jgi:hypothetical protein